MNETTFWVYGLYFFAMTAWTFLVLVMNLFRNDSFFLIFLPYLVFIINIFNADTVDAEEVKTFQGTFLSIGLIVMVSILGWFHGMGQLSRQEISLLLLSLALSLVAHIELGVPAKYYGVYRHYRSILQTLSITIFLIVIVNYFMKEETTT